MTRQEKEVQCMRQIKDSMFDIQQELEQKLKRVINREIPESFLEDGWRLTGAIIDGFCRDRGHQARSLKSRDEFDAIYQFM